MAQLNEDDIQVTEGKMTTFAHRMSLFALDVRPSNYDEGETNNKGWTNIGPYLFAVVGDSPVDIYSFIRVTHPSVSQLEFRLRPFNSAIPAQQSSGEGEVFVLNGAIVPQQSWKSTTYLGEFKISGRGYFAKPRDFFTHLQMAIVPELITDEDGKINLVFGSFVQDPTKLDARIVRITANEPGPSYNQGDEIRANTLSNILSVAAGVDPYFDNVAIGTTKVIPWEYSRDDRKVFMELTLEAVEVNYDHTVRNRWWIIKDTRVTSVVGTWNQGDTFVKHARNTNGIQFGFVYEIAFGTKYQEAATTGQSMKSYS